MKKLLFLLLLLLSGSRVASSQTLTLIDSTTVGRPILYSPENKAMASHIEQMQGKLKIIDNDSRRRHIDVSSKLDLLGSRLDTVDKNLDSIGLITNELEQMLTLMIQKVDSIKSNGGPEPPLINSNQDRSIWPILSLLAGLLTLVALVWGYRKLRAVMSHIHDQEDNTPPTQPQNENLSQILEFLRASQGRNDGISESVATSLASLSRQEDTMTRIANQLEILSNDQDKADLIGKLDALLSGYDEIKTSIADALSARSTSVKSNQSQRDVVVYNAAVDAWLHINNQLFSMGKWRWKIQNVYKLLAGLDVPEEALRSDLQGLEDDERREIVLTIINDIKRFMAIHKPVIDEWLKGANERGIKSLKDAVWMSQGMPFNDERDEEVTGDSVEEGTMVDKVASLGYFFPGSRNGGILQKCKVLVATE